MKASSLPFAFVSPPKSTDRFKFERQTQHSHASCSVSTTNFEGRIWHMHLYFGSQSWSLVTTLTKDSTLSKRYIGPYRRIIGPITLRRVSREGLVDCYFEHAEDYWRHALSIHVVKDWLSLNLSPRRRQSS